MSSGPDCAVAIAVFTAFTACFLAFFAAAILSAFETNDSAARPAA
jgi:hypothetical protein